MEQEPRPNATSSSYCLRHAMLSSVDSAIKSERYDRLLCQVSNQTVLSHAELMQYMYDMRLQSSDSMEDVDKWSNALYDFSTMLEGVGAYYSEPDYETIESIRSEMGEIFQEIEENGQFQ